jgi:hypothetical protein
MKKLALVLALLSPGLAHASCEQILGDNDERHYCRALRDRSLGECAAIISKDRRSFCRAQVGNGGLGECAQIMDNNTKALCRSLVR